MLVLCVDVKQDEQPRRRWRQLTHTHTFKKEEESIFCHKTIINFRFDFFFVRSFFLFAFAFTTTSSSFVDGGMKQSKRKKNYEHATPTNSVCVVWQQHVLHIKTAIPSNTLLSRLSFQCTNQIAVFRSDHPFSISSYHISELLFTSLYLSFSLSCPLCVCAISVCSKCLTEYSHTHNHSTNNRKSADVWIQPHFIWDS